MDIKRKDVEADVPLGWFHSVKTRDAVAAARDGWPYFEANPRGVDATGARIFEIRFGDGEWMLAVENDLLENDSECRPPVL